MAARTRKQRIDDFTRERIKTSQLVNRLTDHALGALKKPMESTQVAAALGLLRKSLPDLQASSVEHTGKDGKDLIPAEVDSTKLAHALLNIFNAEKTQKS